MTNQCEHGQLARVCELCAKDAEIAALREVVDAARRLVEHADFQLGGILSADSKAKDIPSKAVSQVKARHLASLRDRLAALGDKT